MCLCTPEIRTPYCGRGDCVWPHRRPPQVTATSLYEALAHGDDVHRAWLKDAIERHFAGKPVPNARGNSRLEAAACAIYFAAVWSPDRACDAAGLWSRLRDALGIEPGASTKALALGGQQ